METLYPASHTFNINWSMQEFQTTIWTTEDNKKFESCLAFFDKETPDRWIKVASMIPGKTVFDVIEQYRKLVADICDIEAGLFPLPGDPQDSSGSSSSFTMELTKFNEFRKRPLPCRSSDHEKKKGVPWTEDEHRRFLMGLQKYGKGDWRNIARNFVITKTSTQVASHAQKYYLRQLSEGKEKRRPSIHDITTIHLPDTTPSDHYKSPADHKSTFIPQPEKCTSMQKKLLHSDDGSLMMFNSMHNTNTFMPYMHEIGGHGADLNSGIFQFHAATHQIW